MSIKSQGKNRRTFLRALAAAPAISATREAAAQDAAGAPDPEVAVRAELVRLRFGKYLKDDDMPEIKRGIERMLRNAEALSRFKLTNGDEPDFMFHATDV